MGVFQGAARLASTAPKGKNSWLCLRSCRFETQGVCSAQVQQAGLPRPSPATHCGLETYLCTLWGLSMEHFQT